MSNPDVPFPDPIDFAALGRLDAAATPGIAETRMAQFQTDGEYDCAIYVDGNLISEAFGRCSASRVLPAEANAALIVALRNSHAAYREVVVAAKALADAVNSGKFTRAEDLLPKLDAALARFRNVGAQP